MGVCLLILLFFMVLIVITAKIFLSGVKLTTRLDNSSCQKRLRVTKLVIFRILLIVTACQVFTVVIVVTVKNITQV